MVIQPLSPPPPLSPAAVLLLHMLAALHVSYVDPAILHDTEPRTAAVPVSFVSLSSFPEGDDMACLA